MGLSMMLFGLQLQPLFEMSLLPHRDSFRVCRFNHEMRFRYEYQ